MKSARILILGFIVTFGLVLLFTSKNLIKAAPAAHVVISEVRIEGTGDFIELYNPTDVDVDLGDYKLVKRTSTGSSDNSIVSLNNGDVIPANGFFLWCRNDINDSLNCDRSTGTALANNNSIGLKVNMDGTEELVDALTFGGVTNPLGEGTAIDMDSLPEDTASVERKACEASTFESMTGSDMVNGNSWDSEDNSSDFVGRLMPEPQNSTSGTEVSSCGEVTATPTPTDEVTPTPTEDPTVTPTPTEVPGPTVTPTMEPTPTPIPTMTPTPTNTPSPTATPTNTPTPTVTPTPTNTPTPTPTPFQGKAKTRFVSMGLTCAIQQVDIGLGMFSFRSPWLVCVRDSGSRMFGGWW